MGVRVMRKDLESLVGLLMWFSSIAPFHRPFLSEFYRLLRKPRCVNKKVPHAVFGELLLAMSEGMVCPHKRFPRCGSLERLASL